MVPDGPAAADSVGAAAFYRHLDVPSRSFGARVIVARPRDGAPVVLATTATVVWRLLDNWTTVTEIDAAIAAAFPAVPDLERMAARTEILAMLQDDDLFERR
jgi:hypothetical protein